MNGGRQEEREEGKGDLLFRVSSSSLSPCLSLCTTAGALQRLHVEAVSIGGMAHESGCARG